VAAPLALDSAKYLHDEAQVAALGQIVARQGDAKLSLIYGKAASYRGIALDDVAFELAEVEAGLGFLNGEVFPFVGEDVALFLDQVVHRRAGIGRGDHEVRQVGIELRDRAADRADKTERLHARAHH